MSDNAERIWKIDGLVATHECNDAPEVSVSNDGVRIILGNPPLTIVTLNEAATETLVERMRNGLELMKRERERDGGKR